MRVSAVSPSYFEPVAQAANRWVVALVCWVAMTVVAFAAQQPVDVEDVKRRAEAGEAGAMFLMAMWKTDGELVAKDPKGAVALLEKCAEKGSAMAMYLLAINYEDGFGVAKDSALSVSWLKRAAEGGFSPAQIALGDCFLKGTGVKKDPKVAEMWYLRGVDERRPDACHQLAKLYGDQDAGLYDDKKADKWMQDAAMAGNVDASMYLFVLYGKRAADKAVPKQGEIGNGDKSVVFLCVSAVLGEEYAVEKWEEMKKALGDNTRKVLEKMSRDCEEILVEKRKAFIVLTREDYRTHAGLTADEVALLNLERLAELAIEPYGYALGGPWKTKVGEPTTKGEARVMFQRGMDLMTGEGVKPDTVEAMKLMEKSARAGYAPAMYFLAMGHGSGEGLAKDPAQKQVWLRNAANAGVAEAQVEMAECLIEGRDGFKVDFSEAMKWAQKAAEQESAAGQRLYAYLLIKRADGHPADQEASSEWMNKAAWNGDDVACLTLARLNFAAAQQVRGDNTEALAWAYVAADLKHVKAPPLVAEIEAEATTAEQKEAKLQSQKMREKIAENEKRLREMKHPWQ